MKLIRIPLTLLLIALVGCTPTTEKKELSLKEAFNNKFLMGAAMNVDQSSGIDTLAVSIVKQHYNSIVAEDCMKSESLQPREGEFTFDDADKFIEFGQANNMTIIGHTLIWHSQAPKWFFVDKDGKDVSRDVLIERMRSHITTVVERYKGKIKGWDVVNEAILDDGELRKSKFYEIIGEDYISLAFKFAHEADPQAELYYNDYSMAIEAKRDATVLLVKRLREQGTKIDGIGMQGHMALDFPTVAEFEKSLLAFSGLGVKVMITELDITVLPSPSKNQSAEISRNYEYSDELNPFKNGIPDEVAIQLENRYVDIFSMFLKHSDKIDRVTLWGVSDLNSWRNDWPIVGRTDYPLLFDRKYQPKAAVNRVANLAIESNKKKQ